MNYVDYQENLDETMRGLPEVVQAIFSKDSATDLLEEIASLFNLTMGEIGELCELVRRVIVKELPVEKFEDGLKEKLAEAEDDDNLPRVPEIVWEINDKIFVKLLPALGLKALPIGPRPAPPKVVPAAVAAAESTTPPAPSQTSQLPNFSTSKPNPVPLKKILPVPPRPAASQNYPGFKPAPPVPPAIPPVPNFKASAPVRVMPLQPKPKPPIVEVGHDRMSDNPLDSFLKMLAGKLSDKELQARFDKLPYTLKTALRSVDSAKKVVDIGRKYALHVDKLGDLGAETGLVILGITHPAQFLSRLERRLGVGQEKVQQIGQEINAEIFLRIREALKQINGEPPLGGTAARPPSPEFRAAAPQAPPPGRSAATPASPEEEMLDREAILRGIENPAPSRFSAPTHPPAAPPAQAEPQTKKFEPETSVAAHEAAVEPNLPVVKARETAIQDEKPPVEAKPPEIPEISSPAPVSEPAKAAEPKPEDAPLQDMIDQKLSSTVTSAKSESRYSVDPYREALE